MKKIIALIVAVLFVFAVASVSIAAMDMKMDMKAAPAPAKQETMPATKKAEPMKEMVMPAKVMMVTGEVATVNKAAKTIAVKGEKTDIVILGGCGDETLAEVKAGDKVTAEYTSADGKNTAKSVKKAVAAKKAEPGK